jgi:hypothetical protein
MAAPARLLAPLLAAAAVLAIAGEASARAPAASEQGSLEWVLQRLKKDRDSEKSVKPVSSDVIVAYEKGEVAIEEWKPLVERIRNKRLSYADRERPTTAIIARFRLEAEGGKVEAKPEAGKPEPPKVDPKEREKALDTARRQICFECLDLMMADDENSRTHISRLLKVLHPNSGVNWSVSDSQSKRQKAYQELKRKLKG